ncbi:MAG: hypothetical protein DCC75_06610 [Proteobacteria bacterium]|nr:MAG: hypothetical protein DCC75_06610 [Pseudomonadota bacterium]
MKYLLPCLVLLALLSCNSSSGRRSFGFGSMSRLEKAEELSRQGKYDQAIEAYRQHLEDRLKVKDRPEWENPYFYLILIGDIELGQGKRAEALQNYEEADKRGVDVYLISDRIRSVAYSYEKDGKLAEALQLLEKHRAKDALLFDSMLDRIAKELVEVEESAAPAGAH